jgi:ribonucleoside-diphosphate reductase beta chain
MSLTQERIALKPYEYPWAFDAWKLQQQIHWLPDEVPLADDVADYNSLAPAERNLLNHILRFFTQSDIEVNNNYHRVLLQHFKPTELVMMLTAFANMETVHVAAYSHLFDTLGMPATEYEAFLQYKEMKAKFDYMRSFSPTDAMGVAENLAVFGAFTEGLQLFASFAILLNFPRFNKMKGMGQIVTWSVRDESLHCAGITRLYHTWVNEHKLAGNAELQARVVAACQEIVRHEDAFIDLAFELGGVEGLQANDMKGYVRYIADMRLGQLEMPIVYGVKKNPLPFMDETLNAVEHANFFEQRATEYSKGASKGEWGDAFAEL